MSVRDFLAFDGSALIQPDSFRDSNSGARDAPPIS